MIKLRPASLNDANAVMALSSRHSSRMPDPAKWRSQWEDSPFRTEFENVPIGWVLEREGSIVGALSNIHMPFEWNGKRLRGCIGADWMVDKDSRSASLLLLNAFLQQTTSDVCIISSASSVTSEILDRLRTPRVPAPGYEVPYIWPLRRREFAAAALRKRQLKAAGLLAYPAGMALGVADLLRRRGTRPSSSCTVRHLGLFDDRFDAFWQHARNDVPRLRSVRTRACLEWRFQGLRTAILAAEQKGELMGYLVLVQRPSNQGMDLSYVTDLEALGDDPGVLRDLLLGALDSARASRAAGLKFTTSNPNKRLAAECLRPRTYHVPLWQLFYKVRDPEISRELSSPKHWDLSLFENF